MPLVNSMDVPEPGAGWLFSSANLVATLETKVFEHFPTFIGGFAAWALLCSKTKAVTALRATVCLRGLGDINFKG